MPKSRQREEFEEPQRRTKRDEEIAQVRRQEEDKELSAQDRWMIWPKPPTLWELYKGLTKAHVKQVREVQYDCKRCNAKRNVTYRYVEFKRINKGAPPTESRHLAAFCTQCNNRIRFVRDTPARWQVMQESHNKRIDEIRAKSGRNEARKPRRGRKGK